MQVNNPSLKTSNLEHSGLQHRQMEVEVLNPALIPSEYHSSEVPPTHVADVPHPNRHHQPVVQGYEGIVAQGSPPSYGSENALNSPHINLNHDSSLAQIDTRIRHAHNPLHHPHDTNYAHNVLSRAHDHPNHAHNVLHHNQYHPNHVHNSLENGQDEATRYIRSGSREIQTNPSGSIESLETISGISTRRQDPIHSNNVNENVPPQFELSPFLSGHNHNRWRHRERFHSSQHNQDNPQFGIEDNADQLGSLNRRVYTPSSVNGFDLMTHIHKSNPDNVPSTIPQNLRSREPSNSYPRNFGVHPSPTGSHSDYNHHHHFNNDRRHIPIQYPYHNQHSFNYANYGSPYPTSLSENYNDLTSPYRGHTSINPNDRESGVKFNYENFEHSVPEARDDSIREHYESEHRISRISVNQQYDQDLDTPLTTPISKQSHPANRRENSADNLLRENLNGRHPGGRSGVELNSREDSQSSQPSEMEFKFMDSVSNGLGSTTGRETNDVNSSSEVQSDDEIDSAPLESSESKNINKFQDAVYNGSIEGISYLCIFISRLLSKSILIK